MENESNVLKMGLQMSPRVWSNFRWEFASAILGGFFGVVSNQFYIPLAIQHGASNLQVGLMTAAPPMGLLLAPIWASIVEKGQPKPFVILPNLAARILILLPVFYEAPWMFILAVLGVNFLLGVQAPAYASLMTRIYPSEVRGRLMGNIRVASCAMMIPSVYLVGHWIDRSGGSGPMIVASVTGFISVLMFIGFKEMASFPHSAAQKARQESSQDSRSTRRAALMDQLKLMTGNPLLGLFFVVTTIVGFGNMLGVPLYQIIQVGHWKLTNLEIGYIRIAYLLSLLFGYMAVGFVVDRFSPRRAMLISMSLYLTVPLIYTIFGNYSAAIVAGVMNGLADAFWDIGCLFYVFRAAPGREAVVFGLHLMLVGIRGTLAPMISTSLIHSISFQSIFIMSALCILSGLTLFAWNGNNRKGNRDHNLGSAV